MKNERGSILILAIVTVLILSIMAIAGLTVTSIENITTNNYYRTKQAFYKAVEIVENIRMQIYENQDPAYVTGIDYNRSSTGEWNGAVYTEFITGTLHEFGYNTSQPVEAFQGFAPPPFKGMSLDDRIGASPVIWYVPVTTYQKIGSTEAYAEIQSGIYSTLSTSH